MATIAIQTIDLDGLAPTYSAASGTGDKFDPTHRPILHIKNGSGASVTATITTPAKTGGLDVAEVTITVPAGEERFARCPAPELVKGSDGLASISWSATTSITFAVLR